MEFSSNRSLHAWNFLEPIAPHVKFSVTTLPASTKTLINRKKYVTKKKRGTRKFHVSTFIEFCFLFGAQACRIIGKNILGWPCPTFILSLSLSVSFARNYFGFLSFISYNTNCVLPRAHVKRVFVKNVTTMRARPRTRTRTAWFSSCEQAISRS